VTFLTEERPDSGIHCHQVHVGPSKFLFSCWYPWLFILDCQAIKLRWLQQGRETSQLLRCSNLSEISWLEAFLQDGMMIGVGAGQQSRLQTQ